MGFYEELSRYYDEIFPVDASDMRFLVSRMQGRRRLLDLGCGTGNKSVFFASDETSVLGIDSDSAMIDRAKVENAHARVSYEVLDMAEIDQRFHSVDFDGAVCLGNTLVHMAGPEQVASLLTKTANILETGGRLLVQILNYDRILEKRQMVLPVLESAHVIFRREYVWRGEEFHFVTELELRQSGQVFDNDIPLYPLRRAELDDCLKQAGFGPARYYGGFGGQEWTEESFVTIIESDKI